MATGYDHRTIEPKWQKRWEEEKVFRVENNSSEPRKYVLDMFPYPSGDGLHVGHPEGYTATDIFSRYLRMQSERVLHPMGWDAFGLPAENFAIKRGVHPRGVTEKNIANFKRQIQSLGFSYDWNREINTTDPKYYKWTQWIFLQLYKKGLAYEKEAPIWWCPKDKTGLANEEVVNGKCDRCGTTVERKNLRQWVLKITEYADRLLDGLDKLDWPESIKAIQRNWIGRSEGAEIQFLLKFTHTPEANENRGPNGERAQLTVYTTRPDTIFGATYLVLAPEHPWIMLATDDKHHVLTNKAEVKKYIQQVQKKSEIERMTVDREKTGVELLGVKAINPATNEEIPIFVADYVLSGYGTGAIMAVPGHDQRDFEFAKKFDLLIQYVVLPHLTDPKNPPRASKPSKERPTVQAIIHDPKTDTYLCLKWKEQPWTTFIVGGIESGETPIDAAKREILEETGFSKLTFIKQLGGPVRAEYFAAHKDENRVATATALLFRLDAKDQAEVSAEESTKHEIIWQPLSDIRPETMNCVELPHWLENLEEDVTYSGEGVMLSSGKFDGLTSEMARTEIISMLAAQGIASVKVQYKLRDWIFSRQRYWGEPIPLVHCEKDGVVAVPEKDLPVLLPDVEKYEPTGTGESPLAAIADWVNTTCPKCGGPAKRETNTMPQWAGSCWYYLRFCDPDNDKEFASAEALQAWLPVDLYVGGAEHAVLHLLYSRFWHLVLYDIGAIPKQNDKGESLEEPFLKLKNQGLILGPDGEKMSKSRGNVINPDEIVEQYGADTLRLYEMFMGPFEDAKPWDTHGIIGVRRFLDKVYRASERVVDGEPDKRMHKYIYSVSDGIVNFRFNTCVSDLMKWVNEFGVKNVSRAEFETFLKVLSPFAPHLAEELWAQLGNSSFVAQVEWPKFDASKIKSEAVTIAVQINGKHRGNVTVQTGSNESVVREAAEADTNVKKFLSSKPKKVIYVRDRLINFVV